VICEKDLRRANAQLDELLYRVTKESVRSACRTARRNHFTGREGEHSFMYPTRLGWAAEAPSGAPVSSSFPAAILGKEPK
jgi:hypothetical protein